MVFSGPGSQNGRNVPTQPRVYRERMLQYGQYALDLNRQGKQGFDRAIKGSPPASRVRQPAATAMKSAADAVRLGAPQAGESRGF
jgi:hypothetical protein